MIIPLHYLLHLFWHNIYFLDMKKKAWKSQCFSFFPDPARNDGGNRLWFRWHRFVRRMEARRHDHHSPSCPFGPRHGNSPLSKIRHTLCRCLKPSRLLLLQGRPVTNQRNSSSSKFLKLSLLLFAIMECQVLDSFFLISSVWIRDPSTSAFLCF